MSVRYIRFPLRLSLVPQLDLELYCLVHDDDASQVFQVIIPKTQNVYALKKAVKAEKKLALQHVDADALTLWKVSIPVNNSFKENVRKVELKDEETLSSVDRLYEIFSDPLQGKHLHIIVKSPYIRECK